MSRADARTGSPLEGQHESSVEHRRYGVIARGVVLAEAGVYTAYPDLHASDTQLLGQTAEHQALADAAEQVVQHPDGTESMIITGAAAGANIISQTVQNNPGGVN